ncbi:ParA family protein [Spiroplasma endosymbiont of Asaphidion curtum]
MKKITFCNSKGGADKATLTINVAQILDFLHYLLK